MKKSGLVRALQSRQSLDQEPERQATSKGRKSDKSIKPGATNDTATGRRFHTTYYPTSKEFYDEIKIALIREGNNRDFNMLVNDLLAAWLESPGD